MQTCYDVLILGAGPSGLCVSNAIRGLAPAARILVVDCGARRFDTCSFLPRVSNAKIFTKQDRNCLKEIEMTLPTLFKAYVIEIFSFFRL
jgi:threonine dehydrogenase-like Zn-dependent dehydrogenase